MSEIKIIHNPDDQMIDELGIKSWPIWEKEISQFPWHYDEMETCLILEGEVTVIPENSSPVKFGKDDLVIFPAGMSCHWKITKAVRKHYKFG